MNRREFGCGLLGAAAAAAAGPKKLRVYVGTYTRKGSRGIYNYELDLGTGALRQAGLAAEIPSPSFLALDPTGRRLYAVNEVDNFGGEKAGSLTAFAVDPITGRLRELNSASSGGTGPCHLRVSANGKFVGFANYGGGNGGVYAIESDGKLGKRTAFVDHAGTAGPVGRRQARPHAHSFNFDHKNNFALIADLGLDCVKIYRFDKGAGTLTPNGEFALAPGAGPRHLAFHPSRDLAFIINEISCTLTAAKWDSKAGAFTEINTETTLPVAREDAFSTAEVVVHPKGKFVYGSNRGHDSIAVFSIASDGRIARVDVTPCGGKTPRNFNIDPTGQFLLAAHQDSDSISVFRIDAATGKLTPVGGPVEAPVPVCLKFAGAIA